MSKVEDLARKVSAVRDHSRRGAPVQGYERMKGAAGKRKVDEHTGHVIYHEKKTGLLHVEDKSSGKYRGHATDMTGAKAIASHWAECKSK